MSWRIVAICVGLLPAACVSHDQTQYFEVFDPVSGNVNYYRMTMSGSAGLGVEYQLQAGYFSAASVDVLRGRIPEIPEVDLPIENDAAFDALTSRYYAALTDRSDAESTAENSDEAILRRARLVWFGQLSTADVAAMGMNQSANPFEFRKLVFWASARNIDLRAYGSEIDAMIDSATALVREQKARGRERGATRRRISDFVTRLVETQPALAPYSEAVRSLLGDNTAASDGKK